MKKKSMLFFIAGMLITLITPKTTTGQDTSPFWSLAGNNNTTANSKLGTTNSNPLRLLTNNVERMRIDVNGKIGIGTASPVNIFTVKSGGSTPAASWLNGLNSPVFVGFGETVSSEFLLAGASNTSGNRAVFQGRRSRGTLATPLAVANNDYITSLLASAYDGSTFQNPALVSFFVDGVPSAGNVPARISFVTGSNAGNRVERLKVGSTGNFNFNGSQLFIRQSDGFVGIGTTSPATILDIAGGNNWDVNNSEGDFRIGNSFYRLKIGVATGGGGAGDVRIRATGGTNRMMLGPDDAITINGEGSVGIGSSAPNNRLVVTNNTTFKPTVQIENLFDGNFNDALYIRAGTANGTGGSYYAAFQRLDGTIIGSIAQSSFGGGVDYNTISDKRLKTNIHETKFGLADVKKIQVRDYNLPNNKNEQTGFIAQQLYEVFPEAVTKGGEDPEKRPWMVDYGRVTPLLVKAIQELSVQNDEKKATINALQKQLDNFAEELKNLKSIIVNGTNAASVSLGGYLKQNIPNPATNSTVISYYLPGNIAGGEIRVTDTKGRSVKIYSAIKGAGLLQINNRDLPPGVYNYTLYANNKVIDSKQMVITR